MKNIIKFIPYLIFPLVIQAQADELIRLETRTGVTQPVLLWEEKSDAPEFLIVFFPSGNGNVGFVEHNGKIDGKFHFLEKQRELFVSQRFAVAIIDTPSDRKGLGESFRQSEEHYTDVKQVISKLKQRFPKSKLVLMGHSRGSVSAGYVSRALASEVDATVLLSARYKIAERPADAPQEAPGGSGLSDLDFNELRNPLLLIHHVNDGCPSTLYVDAKERAQSTPLVTIDGIADEVPAKPGEFALCSPGTNHWFTRQEKIVGEKIIEWLNKM